MEMFQNVSLFYVVYRLFHEGSKCVHAGIAVCIAVFTPTSVVRAFHRALVCLAYHVNTSRATENVYVAVSIIIRWENELTKIWQWTTNNIKFAAYSSTLTFSSFSSLLLQVLRSDVLLLLYLTIKDHNSTTIRTKFHSLI